MTKVLETTEAVIDAVGGPAKAAEITGRKYSAAWNWTKAETFPANTYLLLNAAILEKGFTAPARLWRMEEPALENEGGR